MTASFRLATFNLENLGLNSQSVPLEERIRILRPMIERLDADILCLQEVNAEESSKHGPRRPLALERLIENTTYAKFNPIYSLNRPGVRLSDRHNLAVLTRFPVLEWRQLWHHLMPGPQHYGPNAPATPVLIEWDRPLLYLRLDVGSDKPLHLINLHLKAPRAAYVDGAKDSPDHWISTPGWAEGFHIASMKRTGQALEARLFVDQLFDDAPDSLIAVAGDLNADDNETPLRILRAEADDTGNAKLAYRSLISLERALPQSQRFSVIHHGRPSMLDHVLASRQLAAWAQGIAAHNEALGDEALSPSLVPASGESYHAPLVATFQEPRAAKA